MSRIARLPVALGLLMGFAVADIPHTFHYPVWIVLAGISPAVCCEIEPRSAMPAKDIPGQKRIARDIARNGSFLLCGVGAGGAYPLSGLKQFRRDDLQLRLNR